METLSGLSRRMAVLTLIALAIVTVPQRSRAEAGSPAIAVSHVRQLVAAGRYEDARSFIRDWRPDGRGYAVRVNFVEGLISARAGDHARAVAIYRDILAAEPGNDVVRIELAASFAALNDADGVRAQAEMLRASGIDDRLGGAITRLADLVDANRPLRFRGYAAILPSTNVNRGTDNDTVPLGPIDLKIDPGSRRKSGIGLLIGGESIYQHPIAPDRRFFAIGSAVGRIYPDETSLSSFNFEAAVGLEQSFGKTRASIALTGAAGTSTEQVNVLQGGIRGEVSGRFSHAPRWLWSLNGQIRAQDDLATGNRDGLIANFGAGLDHYFATGHFLRFGVKGEITRFRLDRYSYDETGLFTGYGRPLPLGINIYAQAGIAWRDYHGLYPGLAVNQQDTRYTGDIVLTKRDLSFAGFAPQLLYHYERAVSNAAFDDIERHEIEMRLTRDF
jgi:outer membrane protein